MQSKTTQYVVAQSDGTPAQTPCGPARPKAGSVAAMAAYAAACGESARGVEERMTERGLSVVEVVSEHTVHVPRAVCDSEGPYDDGADSSAL